MPLGTPLPTEGRPSGRIDFSDRKAPRTARAPFFVRPSADAGESLQRRPTRWAARIAPGLRSLHLKPPSSSPRGAGGSRRLPHRHRAGLRRRRGRDGAVVDAQRTQSRCRGLKGFLGEAGGADMVERLEALEARARRRGSSRPVARPRRSTQNPRRGVRLDSHRLPRRARAGRRLDRGRPRGSALPENAAFSRVPKPSTSQSSMS